MKIIRVLNTNAVLTNDSHGNETVLFGMGIGFKTKPGFEIDESKIEKNFVLKDKIQQSRFQELINNIPTEYILAAEQIISLGKDSYNMVLNESIHVSLADHIYNSVINFQQGILVPSTLLLDIKHYYPTEYKLAVQGLELLNSTFNCQLPKDEISFLAMHFINSQYNKQDSVNINIQKTISLVSELHHFILSELNLHPDEDSLHYYRYMNHLRFFAQRINENTPQENIENDILKAILAKYEKELNCGKKLAQYIYDNYSYLMSEDEILYLTVHLTHLTNNVKQET